MISKSDLESRLISVRYITRLNGVKKRAKEKQVAYLPINPITSIPLDHNKEALRILEVKKVAINNKWAGGDRSDSNTSVCYNFLGFQIRTSEEKII